MDNDHFIAGEINHYGQKPNLPIRQVTSGHFPHRASKLQAFLLQRAAQRGAAAHLETARLLAARHRPQRHGNEVRLQQAEAEVFGHTSG